MIKTIFSLALTAALSLMSVGFAAAQSDVAVGACGSILTSAGARAQFQAFGDLDEQGQPTGFLIYRDPGINFRLRATSNQVTYIERVGCETRMAGTANTTEGPANWFIQMIDNGEPGRNRDTFHILVNTASFNYDQTGVLVSGEIQADGVICPAP